MSDSLIAKWIARYSGDKPLTLAHFCESEIAERKVIRCGRQMGDVEYNGQFTELREAVGVAQCKRCGPRTGSFSATVRISNLPEEAIA